MQTVWLAAIVALLLVAGPSTAALRGGQPGHAAPAQEEGAAAAPAAGHAAEGEHEGGGVLPVVARLFNFALMVGVLVYFLRSPFARYLVGRQAQIGADLARAESMRAAAAAQMADIEEKMRTLPAELEALRATGAAEVAAEGARMRAAAEAERARLLEQARREIALQLNTAERGLVKLAADLAVAVASARITRTITDADQLRLVDRYLGQVGTRN